MDEAELPPLPTPLLGPSQGTNPMFREDQMRAYALAERAAERERCAKVCERESSDPDSATVSEYDDNHMQGWVDAAMFCAAAIRKKQPATEAG